MTSKHSFAKGIFWCATLLSFFFGVTSSAHAAIDVTASIKATTTTSVTVSIKNNGDRSVSSDGRYVNALRVDAVAKEASTSNIVARVNGTSLSGAETKDVVINGLTQNTAYTIELTFERTYNGETKKVDLSATTKKETVTTGVPALPLEFVKSSTVVNSNMVAVVIKNTSKSSFKAKVVVKQKTNGALVDSGETSVINPNTTAQLYFFKVAPNTVYDLTMTGTQVGSTTKYQSVSYLGIKTGGSSGEPLVVIFSPDASGTSIKGQIMNTEPNTAYKITAEITGPGKTETKTGDLPAGNNKMWTVVFDGVTKDSDYTVSVQGVPTPASALSFGPKTYNVSTKLVVIADTGSGTSTTTPQSTRGTCEDDVDNDQDGTADWDGGKDATGNPLPPDASCLSKDSKEVRDDIAKGSIVPCTNDCDLNSVFTLINNLIKILLEIILLPVAVLMFMYAGFKYLTAEGNPSKKADVKKLLQHLIVGLLIILLAWVVVKTFLLVIGYTNNLYFFE